jgi:hypothetical protein
MAPTLALGALKQACETIGTSVQFRGSAKEFNTRSNDLNLVPKPWPPMS